jgi:GNAT superfamily N-acetyltransferase
MADGLMGGAYIGNPNIARQGARARQLAQQRDVNTLPDPRTYAAVSGLLGTRPDEMGFSVLHPDYQGIRNVANPAYALGLFGQAAPALAPFTKGLPVGASIKSIDDIFAKYPNVIIDASVGKKDINLSRIVVPKEMRNQGIGTQVMNDLSEYADGIGKRITLTPSGDFGGSVPKLKTFYKELGFVENKGKNKDFSTRETMYREPKEGASIYPQQEALDIAQRNAALPVEQGGLGLPLNNTPEMRAEAMGFNVPAYHGTRVWEADDGRKLGDIQSFNRLASTEIVGRKPSIDQVGIFASDRPDKLGAGMYAGDQGAIYPLLLRMENPKSTSFEQMARTASNLSTGEPLGAGVVPRVSNVEPYRQLLKEQGFDSLRLGPKQGSPYTEFKDQTGYVLLDPNQIRGRFAAFDPMRRSAAIAAAMGLAAPDLLANQVPVDPMDEDPFPDILR